jgi:N,N'-diacetyllegionaminate synthase
VIVSIGNRLVGPGQPCLVVAEVGLNHGGSIDTALEMVRAAAEAGADCIKVQAFTATEFCTAKATYQGERQIDLFRRYELGAVAFSAIAEECGKLGVMFLGTPDSMDQAKLLVSLGAPAIKVGSDDLVHIPLLRQLATFGLPMILSTGMATMTEIARALEAASSVPVILLHCVSSYPTLPGQANIRRMISLGRHYRIVGYSDHTDGIEAAVGAVWAGACLIEKHFTLDRSAKGPDHAFSADPGQWSEMVRRIRMAEVMRGTGEIDPSSLEEPMRATARRSIVAARKICPGTEITPAMLAYKRPGTGLPPIYADMIIGKRARRTLSQDDQFKEGDWL